jgi:hypothetical protein
METITVRVSQDHINRGISGNCERCPVALALLEAFPEAKSVGVDADLIEIYYQGTVDSDEFGTPEAAAVFISNFDDNIVGEPFEFELGNPR